MPIDERLSKAVAGDVVALTALLAEFGPPLRERLSIDKRWQGVLEVDDVLQVTYLEAFLKIGSFAPTDSAGFGAWLRRIAENNLRDAVRGLDAAKRPPPAAGAVPTGAESAVAPLDAMYATSATPSRAAATTEMTRQLRAALDALPADYAQVLRLYDLEGMDMEHVAARLGRSPGAVHMLRARAHERLRDVMGSDSQFFSRGA